MDSSLWIRLVDSFCLETGAPPRTPGLFVTASADALGSAVSILSVRYGHEACLKRQHQGLGAVLGVQLGEDRLDV